MAHRVAQSWTRLKRLGMHALRFCTMKGKCPFPRYTQPGTECPLLKHISGCILITTNSLGQMPSSMHKLHKGMRKSWCYYSPYFADGENEAQRG